MSQFVGRFVIISALIAVVFLALGYLLVGQAGIRLSKFEQAQASHFANAKREAPPLDEIVVTPCAQGACLLVQAGGREFIVGASSGAADGLLQQGLLTENLDGVILTDLSSSQIEGLIGIRDRSLEAGRKSMLKVYGPSGVERVIEGLNAMLETSDVDRSVRYGQGILPFDVAQAEAIIVDVNPENHNIFDSGVLQINAYPVQSTLMGAEVLYRFDYEGKSLIIGGCGARLVDVNTAKEEGAEQPMLVLPVASKAQLEIIREQAKKAGLNRESRFATAPVEHCLTPSGLGNLAGATQVSGVVASPLYPAPNSIAEQKIWKSEFQSETKNSNIDMFLGQIWESRSVAN